jgi:glutaredoxin 3
MGKNVTVYSTDPCSFCTHAKALLRKRGIEFDEVNLGKDPAGRAELVAKTGMMSFPQIVVSEQVLGGFRELLDADRSGRLDELLAA